MHQALAHKQVAPMSLDICVANTQGVTAYLLVQAFENALRKAGNQRHVVGLVTQVEVDANDPGFKNPTKPVGYFLQRERSRRSYRKNGIDYERKFLKWLAHGSCLSETQTHLRYFSCLILVKLWHHSYCRRRRCSGSPQQSRFAKWS